MIFSGQQVNKTFGFSHRTSSEVFLFWSRCSDDPSEITVHHQQGTTPEWNVISVDWRWKLLTTGAGYPAWWADQRGKALSGLVRVSGETRDSADLFTRRIVWDRGKNKEVPWDPPSTAPSCWWRNNLLLTSTVKHSPLKYAQRILKYTNTFNRTIQFQFKLFLKSAVGCVKGSLVSLHIFNEVIADLG